MTSPAFAPDNQPHQLDQQLVLHARQLREGTQLHQTARFRDDTWELGPALLQHHREARLLNFSVVPVAYRTVAKELCYVMLSGELPLGERRLNPDTIRNVLLGARVLFCWMDSQRPRTLTDLTPVDLSDYHKHLIATKPSVSIRNRCRVAVRYLWRYRHCLPTDRLTFDPRSVDGWDEQLQTSQVSPENATERIPERVLGPLLAWALRFIDDFGPDILAAEQQWRALRSSRPTGIRGEAPKRLSALLDEHRRRARPLPGRDGQVNKDFLARLLGCSRATLDRRQAEIDAVAAEVGISEHTSFDIPITGRLGDQPWINGIITDCLAHNGLAVLARMLYIAAYITIAFLSGMRDSEVKHLRRGCLAVKRDADGRLYRWMVTSLAFKGESDPTGTEATWVVGEPAGRAVKILERLQPPSTDLLLTTLPHGPGRKVAATNTVLGVGTTIKQLNAFVAWINDHCAAESRSDRVPEVNGRPWKLTSRQCRRTLAWFIARRPGGSIAGAIAYRHHAVQLFEGYAGTSESGFRAEVEAEQALARGEHLLAMIDQHEHKTLTGPAAAEAARRLDDFGDRARFTGTVITDPQRLRRLMRREDPAVYQGTYVTCVFNPDKALCLRPNARAAVPALTNCQPLDCRNVALTSDNITAWREEMAVIDQQLARSAALPPLLAERLRDRQTAIAGLLNRHHPTEQQ